MKISAKTSSKETPPRRCAATTYTSRSEVTSIRRHPIVLFYGCRILFFDPKVECGCHHVTEPKSPIWEISQFPNNFGIFSGTLAVSFRGEIFQLRKDGKKTPFRKWWSTKDWGTPMLGDRLQLAFDILSGEPYFSRALRNVEKMTCRVKYGGFLKER